MCARFNLTSGSNIITALFDLDEPAEWEPQPEIRPTDLAPAVLLDRAGRRVFRPLKWGLIPFWAKDGTGGSKMINARSETAPEKPAFRVPFEKQRCIIPADGFFEWTTEQGKKVPHFISRKDGSPLAMAGLWDRWRRDDVTIRTCTVLTTAANATLSPIHDRMPVLLGAEDIETWLAATSPGEELRRLMAPADDGALQVEPHTFAAKRSIQATLW